MAACLDLARQSQGILFAGLVVWDGQILALSRLSGEVRPETRKVRIVWRWMQSGANGSPRVIHVIREIYRDFRGIDFETGLPVMAITLKRDDLSLIDLKRSPNKTGN
jgi:hypothetical protein